MKTVITEKDYLKFKNDQIKRFKGTEKYRSTPALNKNTGSKYFYVGVRKGGKRKRDGLTHIAGRIYHHLGCYSKGSTSGLQLVHWSNKTIRLSVLELPKGASKYLYILEKFYAIKLRPLLGRH
ncbi:hypothetical protein [Croceibacter atlanticus]|uniref:hypothetical protein n=1 Tax=Croceibacter atlanticus TaxID=313588 RepID=UPI0032B24E1E